MNKSKKNFSSKSFKLNKLKTILLFVVFALTLAGGGLLVVNLTLAPTQSQKNLEIVSPIEDPNSNAVSVWDGTVSSTAPSGSGTSESDPYIIDSAQKLAWISANYDSPNCYDHYFKQTVDINLANIPWTPINGLSTAIGLCYYYNGDGHTISNFTMGYDDTWGSFALFGGMIGYIKNLGIESGYLEYQGTKTSFCNLSAFVGCTLGNFVMENCYNKAELYSESNLVGALISVIGNTDEKIIVKNCYNKGKVTGATVVGGLIGRVRGNGTTISNCYNEGDVTGITGSSAGGLIGWAGDAGEFFVNECYNMGSVNGIASVGGIVGGNSKKATITNCYNAASIIGDSARVAGIVGNSTTTISIKNCYNTGYVKGSGNVAGICGSLDEGVVEANIFNCWNSGTTYVGWSNCAGIVGLNRASTLNIYDCYNTGLNDYAVYTLGGILGWSDAVNANVSINNCYNAANLSVTNNNLGGIIAAGTSKFVITNCYNKGNLTGASSIGGMIGDATTSSSIFVVNCYNNGVINGVNKTAGLIGSINTVGCDVNIENCFNSGNVTAQTASYVGGIVGYFRSAVGKVLCCYNTATIKGDANTGGVVGFVEGDSECVISNCFNLGNVSATSLNCGGILGRPYSTCIVNIKACFNVGTISSTNYFGSLLGNVHNDATVILAHSYALTGSASNLIGSGTITNKGSSFCEASVMKSSANETAPTMFGYNNNAWVKTSTSWLFVNGQYPTFRKIVAIPDITPQFTYCGREIAPVISYDSNYLTLSSTTTKATNAGTYSFTLTLKNATTSVWEDGSTEAKTFSWTIDRATIDESLLPTQNGSLNYTGNSQNVSWSVFDSTKITVGGTTSATNAGTYKAVFTPTANYKWADGSTEGKTVEWSIGKKTLTNPSLNQPNNEFTFTGTTQDATTKLQNYQSDKMVQSGVTSALRAGTYVFVVSLKPEYQNNYIFANGQNFVIISWTILPYNLENATIVVGGS